MGGVCRQADMPARSASLRGRLEDLVKALLGAVSHDIAIHPHHIVEEVEGRATIDDDGSEQVQSCIARGEAFGIAILDALAPLGVAHMDMPATPERV